MLKALAPLAVGLGLSLAQRLLGGGRRSQSGQRPKPDYAGANIGDFYPWVAGLSTVGEFVIWKSAVRGSGKGKRRRKGKGKARVDALIGICEGPITGVTKIFANNKLVYINTPFKTRDWLSQNCESWTLYTGDYSQGVDALASANILYPSAYRGLAYLSIKGMAVGDSGDELPQFRFEVLNYPGVGITELLTTSHAAGDVKSLRVVQMQGLEPETITFDLNDEVVLGAWIETRTVSVPNAAGSIAEDNEGRIRLHTYSGSNPAITGYESKYGQWHYKGVNLLPIPDNFEPMGVFPELQLPNYGPLRKLSYVEPLLPVDDALYFAASHTVGDNYTSNPDLLTFYGVPLTIGDIARFLFSYRSESSAMLKSARVNSFESVADLGQQVYGYQLRDGINAWQGLGKLFNLFNIDYSVSGQGILDFQYPGNRQIISITSSEIVRSINEETGEPEPSVSFKADNSVDIPSEVRLMFRDVGRDGENSMAIATNAHVSESRSTVTVTTDATMAFVDATALAREHLSRLLTKKYTISFKVDASLATLIKVGCIVRADFDPLLDTANGWLPRPPLDVFGITTPVDMRVRSISFDENLQADLVCDFYGYGYSEELTPPTVVPVTSIPDDGLPDVIEIEAVAINVPIIGDPTNPLRASYYGRRTSPFYPNDETIPCPRLESLDSVETIVSEESAAIAGTTYNLLASNFVPATVPKCTRLKTAALTFESVANTAFQTYTESAFDRGLGNYFIIAGVLGRARVATFASNVYTLTDCVFGLSGTYQATVGSTHVLVGGVTFDQQIDTAQVLNLPRQIKIYHPLASGLLSPFVDLTQTGLTAKPYPITNVSANQQPSGEVLVKWSGHCLGQSNRVGGRHLSGFASIGYSFTYNYDGGPATPVIISDAEFLVPAPPLATTLLNFTIIQRGEYGLNSDTYIGAHTYA